MFKTLITLSLLFCMTIFSASNKDIIEVEGIGISSTRQDALTQAKRDAVEKGIGVMLISETEIENYMLKKDVVITKTLGSVKKYNLIYNKKTQDGLWEAKIKAKVSKASISKDLAALKILLESMDKPRVMVMIQETRNKSLSSTNKSAETAIIDFLSGKEFNLVDPAQVAALKGSNDDYIRKAANGDPVAAAKLGKDNGAEVILVGTAQGSVAGKVYNMYSGQADLSIKVINCQTGKIIAAKSAHSAKPHISKETAMINAISSAAKKIMDKELFEAIIKKWQSSVNNGASYALKITGVKDFEVEQAILNALPALTPNIVKVIERSWNEKTGIMEIELLYKGNTTSFCTSVNKKEFMPGKARFKVIGKTKNSVKLKAQVAKVE